MTRHICHIYMRLCISRQLPGDTESASSIIPCCGGVGGSKGHLDAPKELLAFFPKVRGECSNTLLLGAAQGLTALSSPRSSLEMQDPRWRCPSILDWELDFYRAPRWCWFWWSTEHTLHGKVLTDRVPHHYSYSELQGEDTFHHLVSPVFNTASGTQHWLNKYLWRQTEWTHLFKKCC